MSKTFQDENFLVWEAFPSSGDFGSADEARIVFHCVTDRRIRPRIVETDIDVADAERAVLEATPVALLEMLKNSRAID